MTTNTGTPSSKRRTFLPIVLDVAVPVGSYYLLKNAFGMGTIGALAWSSVVPAARTVWGAVVDRTLNAFAALILFVNVASVVLGFVSGDARLMVAKDGAIGSVIGIGVLLSVMAGKPMMTPAMKPWLTRGRAEREAAWTRLSAGSEAFRRAERRFSVVWGVALLAECVVRVLLAYTVPVDTMVWLGVVLMIVTMSGTFLVSGALGAGPMAAMIAAELKGCGPTAARTAGTYTVTATPDRTEPRDPADGTDGTDGTDRIDRAGPADSSAKPAEPAGTRELLTT